MKTRQKIYTPFKRLIDIVGSFIGIVFCFSFFWWWVFIINSIVTKGSPVFKQERCGKNSKPFKLYKFRSMVKDADQNLPSLEADQVKLTTKFGRFLRKTSIDETLQLINIFVGKMSFIGPRPLIDKGSDHITIQLREESGANKIRPGLSGYSQTTNKRFSPEKKAEYDEFYYHHFNFFFDAKIFIVTILQAVGLVKQKEE